MVLLGRDETIYKLTVLIFFNLVITVRLLGNKHVVGELTGALLVVVHVTVNVAH